MNASIDNQHFNLFIEFKNVALITFEIPDISLPIKALIPISAKFMTSLIIGNFLIYATMAIIIV